MKFNILTIFPEIFNVLNHGVISKAFEKSFYHDEREVSGNQKQYRKRDLSAENWRNLDFL